MINNGKSFDVPIWLAELMLNWSILGHMIRIDTILWMFGSKNDGYSGIDWELVWNWLELMELTQNWWNWLRIDLELMELTKKHRLRIEKWQIFVLWQELKWNWLRIDSELNLIYGIDDLCWQINEIKIQLSLNNVSISSRQFY